MDDIENPERRAKTQELLGEIEKGKRDLYFSIRNFSDSSFLLP